MEIIFVLIIAGVIISFMNKSKDSVAVPVLENQQASRTKRLNEKQLEMDALTLSSEQQGIFDVLENQNRNLFITGKAGTGKSALLQYFKHKTKKRVVVVAPTGVAALNVGGQTIHSLFRIPPRFLEKESLEVHPRTAFLLRNIDTVVIDEVSMVRADLMDAIDHILQQARKNEEPFGGVQVVFFGDPYQLPPVVNDPELHKYFADNHGGPYFFNAHVWNESPIDIYELVHIFRQKDETFKNMLSDIRQGTVSETLLNELNQRVRVSLPEEGVITLATTNNIVNTINLSRLAKLPGKLFSYQASISGNLEPSSFPTEGILQLKEGAQVMFLRNDKEKKWVNGTIGCVESLSEEEIKVNIDGISYSIGKETWNKIRYSYNQEKRKVEEEVVSSFTQYPLRLAWAITVHKSQGQTYGSVVVDMGGGAFAHGQTYVALSRCATLEGLSLKRGILARDILVDSLVVNFMNSARVVRAGE